MRFWRILNVDIKSLFQKEKEQAVDENEKKIEVIDTMDTPPQPNSDMADNLIIFIDKAIDEWAKLYGIDKLPKQIIFKQALSIMNAWNDTMDMLK